MAVVSVKRARLWIELLPLLRKEFRLHRIELTQPRLSIERDTTGRFNVERLRKAGALIGTLGGATVSLSKGTLLYADKRSGDGFVATDIDLVVNRIRLGGGGNSQPIKGLSLKAELSCGEIRTKGFSVSALKISVDGRDGVFDLRPVAMDVFGGKLVGASRRISQAPSPMARSASLYRNSASRSSSISFPRTRPRMERWISLRAYRCRVRVGGT
ncbi:MAG: hypothetical protein AABZ94_09490 [Candidatus Eisenbacteria bacterium]